MAAAPLPNFSFNLTTAAASLTAAAADVTALAAVPPPVLGGPPPWGLDMEHRTQRSLHLVEIEVINTRLDYGERISWNEARTLNATANTHRSRLFPLHLPHPLIPVPIVPPPPPAGAPPNPPPAIVVPAALGVHPSFPTTRGELNNLTGANLNLLLPAYSVPGVGPGMGVPAKRDLFAQFIGIRL